jgi:dipeptidyl aminopeptidase/acylaminoacyl peptidase
MLRRADAGDEGPRVVAGGDGVQVQQPRFSPDGSHLAFLSDEHGWLNLWVADGDGKDVRPLLEEDLEHGGASWGLGQRSFAWSPDSASIAFTRNERGFGSLHVLDVSTGATNMLGRAEHGGLSWVGERVAAIRSGARTPTQIVVYEGGARTTVARGPVGGFEAADLVEPEAVEWPGDDGETVHGRLYRPAVASATGQDPPPLLVWIKGGPTAQWAVMFIPRIAYFLERGWAVLVPDHRGSTGHGRAYAQAMRGRWGELDVADVAAGMRAAAERGWGDGRRMVPMGGSAGGFTVLNLLAHHPDLCAAGVDLFGVADLLDLDETTHRFEAHYLDSVVGSLPAAADAYRDRSPVNVADQITAPLLILQGDADPVVPPAQSQAIADRLRALGRTVELQMYEGESHGWLRPETVVDELERVESFLRRHVLRWRS